MAIGRVNTGGGGSGGTLVVTGVVGSTVTASKDGKTYSRTINSGGTATFKGLASGTWTVTMTNSTETATRTVAIDADYALTIAYFSASIKITYPASSTCTVTDSSGATVASDTNTTTSAKTWTATVSATGTYTVTATNGDKTTSKSVSITTEGQVESVTLSFELVLFDGGDVTSVTGGWTYKITAQPYAGSVSRKDNLTVGTTLYWLPGSWWNSGGTDRKNNSGYAYTKNTIDVTDYNTITAVSLEAQGYLTVGTAKVSLAVGTVSLDISALTGAYEVRLGEGTAEVEISKLYLS